MEIRYWQQYGIQEFRNRSVLVLKGSYLFMRHDLATKSHSSGNKQLIQDELKRV